MKTKKLGASDLEVPVIGLGCMVLPGFYGPGSEADANGIGFGVSVTPHANALRHGAGIVKKQYIHASFDHRIGHGRVRVVVRPGVVAAPMHDNHVLHRVTRGVMHAQPEAAERGAQRLRLQPFNQRRIDRTDAIPVKKGTGPRRLVGSDTRSKRFIALV